jgi:hypothetical protein
MTYGQQPSTGQAHMTPFTGQTHQATLGSKANPCHPASSSTSAGNSHRSASLTPSGQRATSKHSHTSTQRSSSFHRSASRGHSPARTTFRPTRVASHNFRSGKSSAIHRSDIRLKDDIVPLARLDNGIGVYRFRYKGNDHTAYVGVMAQEVATIVPDAVIRGHDGYLRVNYDRLGFEFMTWDKWMARRDARFGSAQ